MTCSHCQNDDESLQQELRQFMVGAILFASVLCDVCSKTTVIVIRSSKLAEKK